VTYVHLVKDRVAAADLDARTPADRDRYVDAVRALSIVFVVVGHWLIADLTWCGGLLRKESALGEVPWMWPLTWLMQVIPLFFFVGGFANGRSWAACQRRGQGYAAFLDRRMRRLLAPTAVYLVVVTAAGALLALSDTRAGFESGSMLLQPV
jgi:peptidoglycan/LPS O-acetylase OafA/YrhL